MKKLFLAFVLCVSSALLSASSWLYVPATGGGGYNPATALSSIKVWYRANDSCTGAAGALVSCTDVSGNSNPLIPSTLVGTAAPIYPGTTINGLNTVEMVRSGFKCGKLTSNGPQPPYTIFAVIKLTATPAVNTCLFSNVNGQLWNLQGGVDEIYDNAHFLDVNQGSHTSGNVYFYTQTTDGTIAGTKFYIGNSALTTNSSSGTTFTSANLALQNIGCGDNGAGTATYGTDMLLGEFVQYGVVGTPTQLSDAYTYYKAKWNTL